MDAQEAVGTERLHQPLHGALPKEAPVAFSHGISCLGLKVLIIGQQMSPLLRGNLHVGITEQGGQIVLGQAGTHPLEVNEGGLPLAD